MMTRTYDLNQLALHIHFFLDKMTYPGWEVIRNLVNVHSLYWIHEAEGTFRTNTEHKVRAGKPMLCELVSISVFDSASSNLVIS
ncbi:hypothetical protein [Paenibacillus puerhi]|uniref:hypothetical protein n=1 Tax=Paenibacillus puerhi TaxID=2692622 RepID=UPI00135A7682|nr:hypothetical protein [Paenibacillus puerhi]